MAISKAQARREVWDGNVVAFRLSILPRHVAVLRKWLDAGRCMGLCDASVYEPSEHGPKHTSVLIWVRENADPAYMVSPDGTRWAVIDQLRENILVRVRTFEEALNFIRPVLKLDVAA